MLSLSNLSNDILALQALLLASKQLMRELDAIITTQGDELLTCRLR